MRWLDAPAQTGSWKQFVDLVCDPPDDFMHQFQSADGGVTFRDVRVRCMVDEPPGRSGRQYEHAVGDGEGAIVGTS